MKEIEKNIEDEEEKKETADMHKVKTKNHNQKHGVCN